MRTSGISQRPQEEHPERDAVNGNYPRHGSETLDLVAFLLHLFRDA